MAALPQRRRLTPTSNSATSTETLSLDLLLKSVLAMESPATSIELSLERIVDSSPLQSDKESLLDSARRVASALSDAAIRSQCKHAAAHNSSVWPLPADLTVKVFSMLDTESVCCAAATCSLFSKYASNPLCYANIDLTRNVAKVRNPVVYTMIKRAGKNLRSIKLGKLPKGKKTSNKSPLTASCLSALVLDGGASGLLLRQLHLHNLRMHDNYYLFSALSACQSLVELQIIRVNIRLSEIFRTICEHCPLIEHLCLDVRSTGYREEFNNEKRFDLESLELLEHPFDIRDLNKTCSLLSSLALRGFYIGDDLLSVIIEGARGLKSLDLSGTSYFEGNFLRDNGKGGCADFLEILILRDCDLLDGYKVHNFMSAIISGDWKALRYLVCLVLSTYLDVLTGPAAMSVQTYLIYIYLLAGTYKLDISQPRGYIISDCNSLKPSAIDISQISQERPDIHLIADFPPNLCFLGGCTCSPPPSSYSSLGEDWS